MTSRAPSSDPVGNRYVWIGSVLVIVLGLAAFGWLVMEPLI